MASDADELLRLAQAVADGEPVNWQRALREHRALEPELRRLQLLESLGAFHAAFATDDMVTERSTTEKSIGTDRPSPRQWGSLRIVEKLGQGAFGEVFRAFDPTLQRDVALKLRRARGPADRVSDERFLDEARRLARVRHPNVLVVHGADRHDGRVGLWTDLLEGETLEQSLQRRGTLSAHEATGIGIDLCQALAAVHGAGLVHRDVKTANVMRESGGRIVLMDFSSVTDRPGAGAAGSERISGTPAFMAPELFDGQDSGVAADIYSLGVLLYRLVSGKFPIEARGFEDLRQKHRRGEYVPLRDVRSDAPRAFVRVVERAIAREPAKRYPSAGEMERDLLTALGTDPVQTPIPTPRAWWKRPAVWAAAAATLAVAAVIVYWLVDGRFDVDAEFYRLGANVEERLQDGGRVRPGDQLFLELQSSTDLHVYVLNEDERGAVFVLFPLPDLDLQNPLSSGVRHRLPGTMNGDASYWDVTSVGGREVLLVIASRGPLDYLESELARLPRARSGAVPELADPSLVPKLRGIGGLSRPEPQGESSAPTGDVARQMVIRAGSRGDIWIWQLQLSNPGE